MNNTRTYITQFTVSKRCGNGWTGYLNPGDTVEVEQVIVNTMSGRSRVQVWHPNTLTVSVPVGSIDGLKAAMKAGAVRIARWVPGSLELAYDDE
jgi:hypothetical protein